MASVLPWLLYETSYWAIHFGLTLGFSLRIRGNRNIPKTGPALLVANHQSYLDPIAVGLATHRHLCYLAKKQLLDNKFIGPYLDVVNCVPIDQVGVGKDGIRAIIAKLEQGWPVLMFPEGSRTEDGHMLPLSPGVALLVKRVHVPVIPVGIEGAYNAWPKSQLLPHPSPLFLPPTKRTMAVSIGEAIPADELSKLSRDEMVAKLTQSIDDQRLAAGRLRRSRKH